jgi:hypothetical protein
MSEASGVAGASEPEASGADGAEADGTAGADGAAAAGGKGEDAGPPPGPGFGNYQNDIYLNGLDGRLPPFTTDLTLLGSSAREHLDSGAFGYLAGAAGSGSTHRANREAFDRHRLVPRMLRGPAARDLRTTVLGTEIPAVEHPPRR